MHLSVDIQKLLKSHAERNDEEVCGAIFSGKDTALVYIPIPNVSTRPMRHFLMWPELLQHIEDNLALENFHLTALFHSHSTGDLKPSESDVMFAFYPELVYIIGDAKELRAWSICDNEATEVKIEDT